MSALDDLLHEVSDPSNLPWNAETYDVIRASTLGGTDRDAYVAKLMENAQQGDTRALLTLGHLDASESIPMLQAEAKRETPWAGTARRALVLLGRGSEVLDAIAHDALHAPGTMARVAAVVDLPKIGGIKAFTALDQALNDVDSAVRMLAWDGLVSILDLDKLMRNPEGKLMKATTLELLRDFLASDIVALRTMGADEIRRIVRQLAGGAEPASLGVTYTPAGLAPDVNTQMITAMFDTDVAYPIDEVSKLRGVPRRRAEALLASRALEKDPRVADALVRLAASWTVPVLEEVAQSPTLSSGLREQLMHAVRELKTPVN
jgi:hypothetical protein